MNSNSLNASPSLCKHCEFPLGTSSDSKTGFQFCCYGCSLAYEISGGGERKEINTRMAQLLVGTFFSMLVMVFSVPLYTDAIYGGEGEAHPMGWLTPVFSGLACLASLPVLVLLGFPIALNSVRMGFKGSVDLLILVGVLSAFLISIIHWFSGNGEIYFETASLLLVLLTAGRALEASGKAKMREAFKGLLNLCPDQALLIEGENETEVSSSELELGNIVKVLPGERIPCDGVILKGTSTVDRSLLTGESWPEEIVEGNRVVAGTLNLESPIQVRVEHLTGERWLDRVVQLIESAKSQRGALDRLADRLSRMFLPFAVTVSLITFLAWWPQVGLMEALLTGLSTLLIACPCALGIATPIANWAGIRRAARLGAVVRDGEVFELLTQSKNIAMDKTGTVTLPTLNVTQVQSFSETYDSDEILAFSKLLAKESKHPISTSIQKHPLDQQVDTVPKVHQVQTIPGKGLLAQTDRGAVKLGSLKFVTENWTAEIKARYQNSLNTKMDKTSVYLGNDDELFGGIQFEETLRPNMGKVVQQLQELGYTVTLLSGDSHDRVKAIATPLGVEYHGELAPEQKVEVVKSIRENHGPVIMVGDGLNDAPVLAFADVGIAISSGADIACETASLLLLSKDEKSSLEVLIPLIQLAKGTIWRMRFNLTWAFGYNLIGMGLATMGIIHPLLAATLMAVSSLLVVATSFSGSTPTPISSDSS